jgi:ADP-ribosylglycohydrolase
VSADRIAGALFGAAIGDALGSAFEMLRYDDIERQLGAPFALDYRPGARGSLLAGRAPGEPTDDTAMALSVAFALAGGEPPSAALFARCFLADLERGRGRFAAMFWDGAPGGATTQALRRLQRGAPAERNGHPDDGGNGAAMRAHPAGALPDRNEAARVAALQAEVTHGHPAAIAAAQAVAVLVHDAIAGKAASSEVPDGITEPSFTAAWHAAHRELDLRDGRLPSHLRNAAMSGWATVAAAHAITLVFAGDPERAIAAAAASGGDTDTVACIAGAIAGARAGKSALPERWLRGLAPAAARACDDAATALAALRDEVAAR